MPSRPVTSKLLVITFLLVDALFITYLVQFAMDASPQSYLGQLLGKRPCDKPIGYSLGTFDTRFGISKQAYLDAIEMAAHVWEDSIGRNLFDYDEANGPLKMNLVYDYRQESTVKLQKMGISLNNDKATYDALKAKYNSLFALLKKARASFNAMVDAHNARVAALEKRIAYWNAKGGAPPGEYEKLKTEEEAIKAEEPGLRQREAEVNELVDDLNAVVPALNAQAKRLNLQSVDYNETAAPLAKEFEEGMYSVSASGTQITIFQYDTHDALVRVLEHELGHALGLEHIENPKAIMYRLNDGQNARPTADDVALLKEACGMK